MPIELLKIHNSRNLLEFSIKPHKKFSVLYGVNGVGKTTILESIYLLLRSRTFRSNKLKNFINHDADFCTIFSKFSSSISTKTSNAFTLGISRSKSSIQPIYHLNSKKITKLSSISELLFLAIITPESFNLLDAGPSARRKFLDWGVFHVEHDFIKIWKDYKKTLSSRNMILQQLSKKNKYDQEKNMVLISCWNSQLVDLNNKIHNYRQSQVQRFLTNFKQLVKKFSKELSENVSLTYYQGWSNEFSYKDYLINKVYDDLKYGYTRYGTHRSELKIKINNNLARDILSRGQKKIIIISLILAQLIIVKKEMNIQNLLLLDDIDSELDENNLHILLNILRDLDSQIIMTTTNKDKYSSLLNEECLLFHVKHP